MKYLFHHLLPLTGSVFVAFAGALALGFFLIAIGGPPALAQATSTSINASPLMTEVVWPVLGALAVGLAGWVATKAAQWLHLSSQDVVRGYVLKALQTGLDVAQARLAGAPLTIETHNQTIASIANYLITAVPQGLKMLGFTLKPDDPKLLALVGAHVEAQALPTVASAAPPGPAAS